jgi:hypothetical protein
MVTARCAALSSKICPARVSYEVATQLKCENVETQRQQHVIAAMPNIDLPEDEYADVVAAARKVLDPDKYPMSPRVGQLKGALAKLDPAAEPRPIIRRSPLPTAPIRSRDGTGRGGDGA